MPPRGRPKSTLSRGRGRPRKNRAPAPESAKESPEPASPPRRVLRPRKAQPNYKIACAPKDSSPSSLDADDAEKEDSSDADELAEPTPPRTPKWQANLKHRTPPGAARRVASRTPTSSVSPLELKSEQLTEGKAGPAGSLFSSSLPKRDLENIAPTETELCSLPETKENQTTLTVQGRYTLCAPKLASFPLVKTVPNMVMDISLAPEGEGLLAVSFDFGVVEGTMRLFAGKMELLAFDKERKPPVPPVSPVSGEGGAGSDLPSRSNFQSSKREAAVAETDADTGSRKKIKTSENTQPTYGKGGSYLGGKAEVAVRTEDSDTEDKKTEGSETPKPNLEMDTEKEVPLPKRVYAVIRGRDMVIGKITRKSYGGWLAFQGDGFSGKIDLPVMQGLYSFFPLLAQSEQLTVICSRQDYWPQDRRTAAWSSQVERLSAFT